MTKAIQFRNSTNQRYSKQLFWEEFVRLTDVDRHTGPSFSLYSDKPGMINFGKEYVNDLDPSGYKTAVRLLENYDFFTHLMKHKWFVAAKEIWDREIEARLYSEGLDKIRELAKGDDAKALTAAKFLANKSYRAGLKETKVRGRPSSEEIAGHLKNASADEQLIIDDALRIANLGADRLPCNATK